MRLGAEAGRFSPGLPVGSNSKPVCSIGDHPPVVVVCLNIGVYGHAAPANWAADVPCCPTEPLVKRCNACRGTDMHEATRRLLGVLLRHLDGFDANKRTGKAPPCSQAVRR